MSDDAELSEQTKAEMAAGKKILAANQKRFGAAMAERGAEEAAKVTPDDDAADKAAAEAKPLSKEGTSGQSNKL